MRAESGLKYDFKASLAISFVTDISVEIVGGGYIVFIAFHKDFRKNQINRITSPINKTYSTTTKVRSLKVEI